MAIEAEAVMMVNKSVFMEIPLFRVQGDMPWVEGKVIPEAKKILTGT
jgi:hypothetical protein